MKKYFRVDDEEFCYPKKYWEKYLIENDLESIELIEAKRETNTDHFFCKEYLSIGLKSEGGCGVVCEHYKPRNGKNGRCVNSAHCYEETNIKITIYANKNKSTVH